MLIQLTEIGDPAGFKMQRIFWVNLKYILRVQVDDENDTLITFSGGDKMYVKETPDHIINLLKGQ